MTTTAEKKDVQVYAEIVQDERELSDLFSCWRNSFGLQTKDAFWLALNPDFETEEGFQRGVDKLVKRFQATRGKDHTWFVKGVVRDAKDAKERIAGATIWTIASSDKNPVQTSLSENALHQLYPTDEKMRRYAGQMFQSFFPPRRKALEQETAKAQDGTGAMMVLDICAVDPAFQKLGLSRKMVQLGLDIADERKLPCWTEASVQGRPVYEKMGFVAQSAHPTPMELDDDLKDWPVVHNVCLYRPVQD